MTNFLSFKSTVNPFSIRRWIYRQKVLVDANNAPMGLQATENGPDGIWGPVDLSAAQIAAPTTLMIADLYASYRLSVPPYTRYRSDGTTLQMMPSTGDSPMFGGGAINAGVPLFSVATITPAGSNQATGTPVATQTVILGAAPSTTGVVLPSAATVIGIPLNFINMGTAAVHLYGNGAGAGADTIDTTAGTTGVTLTNAHRCIFTATAAGAFVSGPEGGVTS
jgi:hypothetical protein